MSVVEYLKGELEAIATLIDQKTKEIEQLTERKSAIEKEIGASKQEAPKEASIEKKAKAVEEVKKDAPAKDPKPAYTSWKRDKLKAELEAREIKFAKNAKTEKLVELLEESDQ